MKSVNKSLPGIIAVPVVLLVILALHACASDRPTLAEGQSSLAGMIYDSERLPVLGALVGLESQSGEVLATVSSDVRGRFMFASVPFGTWKLSVKGPGIETLKREVQFARHTDVLYVQVISHQKLVDLFLTALTQRRSAEARDMLSRMELSGFSANLLAAGRAATAILDNDAIQAELYLQQALSHSAADYDIYLWLADIAEFRLGKPELARSYLEQALNLRRDPVVLERWRRMSGR